MLILNMKILDFYIVGYSYLKQGIIFIYSYHGNANTATYFILEEEKNIYELLSFPMSIFKASKC